MIYINNARKIDMGFQTLLRFRLRNVMGCMNGIGRAIAQTVTGWFPTAEVEFLRGSGHAGFVVIEIAFS